MKLETLLVLVILTTSGVTGAQNNTSSQESSGILSSLPDIQINSIDRHNTSTGQANSNQSTLSWIIILGLVFLGVVLYSFDIDPKWIVLLIGVATLVFFLTRSGLMSF